MTIDPTLRALLDAVRDAKCANPDPEDVSREAVAARIWAKAGYPIALQTGQRFRPLVWALDLLSYQRAWVATVAGSDGRPMFMVGRVSQRDDTSWCWALAHNNEVVDTAQSENAAKAAAEDWWLEHEEARLRRLGGTDAT